MKILVTGAHGFLGKNLCLRLSEIPSFEISTFVRGDSISRLTELVASTEAVIHLAGENRPPDPKEFQTVNFGLTRELCSAIELTGRKIPLLLASSTQAELNNPYGKSKLAAEEAVALMASKLDSPVAIYRLPGIFGKWCKPNYNSVVATYCHNASHGLPLQVNDPDKLLRIAYVDDVMGDFLDWTNNPSSGCQYMSISQEYEISLGDLAEQIESFKDCRNDLVVSAVGLGLTRALYATYVSYLPKSQFAYELPAHTDSRGTFVEMLKTRDAGQISYFTAHPGVTRGGHYHHTKTEKFLVLKGQARFGFRHMLTNEMHQIQTTGEHPQVVETVPGWTHDITNIGSDEMVVMLWANEIFDRARPDTISSKV